MAHIRFAATFGSMYNQSVSAVDNLSKDLRHETTLSNLSVINTNNAPETQIVETIEHDISGIIPISHAMTADSLFNVFGTTPAATSETNHDLKMTFNDYAMSRRDQPKHVIYRKRAVCQQFLEHYRKEDKSGALTLGLFQNECAWNTSLELLRYDSIWFQGTRGHKRPRFPLHKGHLLLILSACFVVIPRGQLADIFSATSTREVLLLESRCFHSFKTIIGYHYLSRKLNYNIFKYLLYAFIFTKHLGYTFEDDGLDMYREDDKFFEFLQLVYSKYCPPLSNSGNQVVRFVRGIQLTEFGNSIWDDIQSRMLINSQHKREKPGPKPLVTPMLMSTALLTQSAYEYPGTCSPAVTTMSMASPLYTGSCAPSAMSTNVDMSNAAEATELSGSSSTSNINPQCPGCKTDSRKCALLNPSIWVLPTHYIFKIFVGNTSLFIADVAVDNGCLYIHVRRNPRVDEEDQVRCTHSVFKLIHDSITRFNLDNPSHIKENIHDPGDYANNYPMSVLLSASNTSNNLGGLTNSLLHTSIHHKSVMLPADTMNRGHMTEEMLNRFTILTDEFIVITLPRSQSMYVPPVHAVNPSLKSYSGIGSYFKLDTKGVPSTLTEPQGGHNVFSLTNTRGGNRLVKRKDRDPVPKRAKKICVAEEESNSDDENISDSNSDDVEDVAVAKSKNAKKTPKVQKQGVAVRKKRGSNSNEVENVELIEDASEANSRKVVISEDSKWAIISNLSCKTTIYMCRPHDKESIDASRATTFTKTNIDISGCSVCLGKKEGLSHLQNLVACKNCRRSAHWECVGIPVNVGTKPSTRPSRLWDCIYCLHLCECCFETCTNVSLSQCDSCLKMICKDCQVVEQTSNSEFVNKCSCCYGMIEE